MTAIVGTINRRGVAFAADSAATHTISSRHKITNHANKIFELSKYCPVGAAICGNLDFLGMPWEDIFKMYRSYLKDTSKVLREDWKVLWNCVRKSASIPRTTVFATSVCAKGSTQATLSLETAYLLFEVYFRLLSNAKLITKDS